MTAFWCEAFADLAPMSLLATDPQPSSRSCRAAALPDMRGGACWCAVPNAALEASCALLAGQAFGEYEASGTSTDADARRAAAGERPARADVHAIDQGDRGPRHDIDFDAAQASSVRSWLAGPGPVPQALRACGGEVPPAGFILADTKFELGLIDGELTVCDELSPPTRRACGRR